MLPDTSRKHPQRLKGALFGLLALFAFIRACLLMISLDTTPNPSISNIAWGLVWFVVFAIALGRMTYALVPSLQESTKRVANQVRARCLAWLLTMAAFGTLVVAIVDHQNNLDLVLGLTAAGLMVTEAVRQSKLAHDAGLLRHVSFDRTI